MGYNVRIGNEQCQPRRLQYKTACRLYIADRAADRANARESGRAKRFRTCTARVAAADGPFAVGMKKADRANARESSSGRQQRNSKEVYYGQ